MQYTEKRRGFESNPLPEALFHTFNTRVCSAGTVTPTNLYWWIQSVYTSSARSSPAQYPRLSRCQKAVLTLLAGDCYSLPCWERRSSYWFSHGFFFVTDTSLCSFPNCSLQAFPLPTGADLAAETRSCFHLWESRRELLPGDIQPPTTWPHSSCSSASGLPESLFSL